MDTSTRGLVIECGEKVGKLFLRTISSLFMIKFDKQENELFSCFISFYRSPNQFCTGTDLNRNWGYHWNDGGSSNNPCTDSYMGKSAFSEIENQNVIDFLSKHKDTIKYYVNLHSYSQLVLLPWGYTEDPMPVYDRYLEVANKV